MVTELSLYTGGEYQVFILLHIRNKKNTDGENFERVKARHVPAALLNMTEAWTYSDCQTEYPAVGEYE